MFNYSIIQSVAENPSERKLGDRAVDAFARILNLRDRRLVFIQENSTGEISSERPLLGLSNSNGRDIFVLKGLACRAMVLTIAHELAHESQRVRIKKLGRKA